MLHTNLINTVRKALAHFKAEGMTDEEFAAIIKLEDVSLDGTPHRKFRLNGHISYASTHQGNYRIGSLKHVQHCMIAAYYLEHTK